MINRALIHHTELNDVFDGNSILEELSSEYQLSLREDMFEALTGLEEGTLANIRSNKTV
ncbi:hypothetical protein ACRS6Y_07910 [Bacillus cytotoxicus]|uniref:Uncharacterized protein n=1 Tax=Bacillus cytotoxicus (strain DSM 22905 / CIP 110041 / 391-98 / NVH 391-98) TaxID=315749 RepID=A7GTU0_BACCN|nr:MULTISPECIES: hypothetical protein [Bacillus cereus group]ABS23548.1 hypothetical protein Bcer98_3331 [Bacillus cytotoxicus NVH 391-98]MDH2859076.1 hypothetical protein [Bacillus cytotoxicus]MDH2864609.1 hypothetical protein [Bacillus cytotoxicus]MDH2868540.1 hypothetical protein [Bacillus cytotoxicus]MDH2870690.1 hypothetical protein [Bacillus cytotoxicus]